MFEIKDQVNVCLENQLYMKLDYLNHLHISGNKYRKLKYNLLEAKRLQKSTLLTFGGAFSNHIAAVAAAGREFGFRTIGVIRGEELVHKFQENPTLAFAKSQGMQFHFITRLDYREKETAAFIANLKLLFGDFYLLPEGGTNQFAISGCEEILTNDDKTFDYICCPVGTGGTISGLINASLPEQKILGFPALKGSFLQEEISKFANKSNWELIADYHFGGYAKINRELISFINSFKNRYQVPLDPVYTGKMVFGVFDLIKKDYFPKNAKILMLHTGGLQGIAGMNVKLLYKNLPIIQ